MTDVESYAREQIATIIPKFDDLELRATVTDSGHSVEFFVLIDGERKQCYELADDGAVDEEELDEVLARIAEYIRKGSDYKKGRSIKLPSDYQQKIFSFGQMYVSLKR